MQVTVAHPTEFVHKERLDDGVAFQLLTDAFLFVVQHPRTRCLAQLACPLNLAGVEITHVQTAVDVGVTVCGNTLVTHTFAVHNLVRPLGALT